MSVSAADIIAPALRHTKEQLLRPFRLGQWARLAFVGILAGEMQSFGFSFNYPLNTQHHQTHSGQAHAWLAQLPDYPAWLGHPWLIAALVGAVLLVALGLGLLFAYIASVMRFILFDSIVARECHVRSGWARRKSAGLRLFRFYIWFGSAEFAVFLIVVGIPLLCAWGLGWFTQPRAHLPALVIGGILLLVVFLCLIAVAALIAVMTKDFVVPQMALEGISAVEGWRRLWLWVKFDKGGYAGYLGIKIALALGAGFAFVIATIIVMLALLLPVAGVVLGVVHHAKTAGWTWNAVNLALTVLAACLVLTILICLLSLLSVPVIVFFPAYSIYFFAHRYSQLAALLWPPPPAPAAAPA